MRQQNMIWLIAQSCLPLHNDEVKRKKERKIDGSGVQYQKDLGGASRGMISLRDRIRIKINSSI